MKKGIIPDLRCKGHELSKKKNDDENNDPDAAEGSEKRRHLSGDMSTALVLFEGESTEQVGEGSGKGKTPAQEDTPAKDEVLFVKPLDVILTADAVDKIYMDAAANIKKKSGEAHKTADFVDEKGFDKSSSSDHDSLIREIQIKYGHDKTLVENVYADLMERKFQEDTANELSKKDSKQYIVDSLSSSDSEYVPEKDK